MTKMDHHQPDRKLPSPPRPRPSHHQPPDHDDAGSSSNEPAATPAITCSRPGPKSSLPSRPTTTDGTTIPSSFSSPRAQNSASSTPWFHSFPTKEKSSCERAPRCKNRNDSVESSSLEDRRLDDDNSSTYGWHPSLSSSSLVQPRVHHRSVAASRSATWMTADPSSFHNGPTLESHQLPLQPQQQLQQQSHSRLRPDVTLRKSRRRRLLHQSMASVCCGPWFSLGVRQSPRPGVIGSSPTTTRRASSSSFGRIWWWNHDEPPTPPRRRRLRWHQVVVTLLLARFVGTLYSTHASVMRLEKEQQQQRSTNTVTPPLASVSSSSDLLRRNAHPPIHPLQAVLPGPTISQLTGRRVTTTTTSTSSTTTEKAVLMKPERSSQPNTKQSAAAAAAAKYQERRRRTTPPPAGGRWLDQPPKQQKPHAAAFGPPAPLWGVPVEPLAIHPWGFNDTTAVTDHSHNARSSMAQQLCHEAGLNASSRLLVLSLNGVTTSFLLVAARVCGVRNAIVVDPLTPNLRTERLKRLHRHLRILQRPALGLNVQFHVPTNAATLLHPTWLTKFACTHVLAFQSSSSEAANTVMDEPSRRLYALHHHLLLWNQAVQWVRMLRRQHHHPSHTPYPRMLFASAHAPTAHPHDKLIAQLVQLVSMAHASSEDQPQSSSSTTITANATFLPIAHVNLPFEVVGPLMDDPPSRTNTTNVPPNARRPEDAATVLYVSDAVNALLRAFATLQTPAPSQLPGNNRVRILEVQPSPWLPSVSPTQWRALLNQVSLVSTRRNSTASDWDPSKSIGSIHPHDDWVQLAAMQSLHSQHDLEPQYVPKSSRSAANLVVPSVGSAGLQLREDTLHSKVYQSIHAKFPCSSACRRSDSSQCQSSPWDRVRPLSIRATSGCTYVVYLVFLHGKIVTLPKPSGGTETDDSSRVCRVAFLHADAPLVRTELTAARRREQEKQQQQLQLSNGTAVVSVPWKDDDWNGRIESNRWTLVWLNTTKAQLSAADHALPKIDPSHLFAHSVERAMYAEYVEYVTPSDASLARILRNVDRPALPYRYRRERRSGIPMIGRWVPIPAEPARRTVLFASEPALTGGGPSAQLPKTLREFVRIAGDAYYFPPEQLRHYDQVSHLVQTNDMRPEPEIRSTLYPSFPYQWLSMSILIHELVSIPAHDLRCRWYDEYLHWGGNVDAEELTLGFVMASMRIAGTLGLPVSKSVDSPTEDLSWLPLMNYGSTDAQRRRVVGGKGNDNVEAFVRIMRQRNSSP